MNLRALAEKDLKVTLEGDFGQRVNLLAPDGTWYRTTVDGRPLMGQVQYNIVRLDPDSGERITVNTQLAVLRRSSLARVPEPGENWLVETAKSPVLGSPMVQFAFSGVRPPEGGATIGFIRLYLQLAEQSDPEPPPEEPVP